MDASGRSDAGTTEDEQALRSAAVKRIKQKREFLRNLVLYLLVNAGLWAFWAYDGADTDDLWPALVSGIWGVLLVLDLFKIYRERPISEQQIEDEIGRFKGR